MKTRITNLGFYLAAMIFLIMTTNQMTFAQSQLDCKLCHGNVYQQWLKGSHSHTQMDVADELSEERVGESPDSVLYGSDPENCIACHSPLAVTVNGGMTEAEALGHFFTTTNGVFTDSTTVADTTNWPHNWCTTCHNVPSNHPASLPVFGYFNSTTTSYDTVANVPSLCGQCHGNLHFPDTDHLTYNAWKMSKHSDTQDDVAEELAEERAGETPDSVISGSDPENCIACHAPTAVLANGGMTEAEALDYFFTTSNGAFSASTTSKNQADWPSVACNTCHNPHYPNQYSYFNSTTKKYTVFDNSAELCGQCHGNLRFPDTDHLTYNIIKGGVAVGVTFEQTMPGASCTDCHMYSSDVDGSNSAMYHGHSWSIFVAEEDGSETVSCASCHSGMNAASAKSVIKMYKEETQAKLDSAEQKVTAAETAMQGNTDSGLLAKLEEAQTNLFLVQSDESEGFHNHKYQMDLLADVIQKSNEILNATGVKEETVAGSPTKFELFQNYPNPFNPSTKITYELPRASYVTLEVFNILGNRVCTLVKGKKKAGRHSIVWDGKDDLGHAVPNGVYVYRIQAGHRVDYRKMTLLK
ncbi:MAG: ammonia-forming cytochrome c nitrite reductase subunit c552 [Calditrichaeota bacterium]|nr:ammonia-forming cytochrome c nitrite reductase subunit c552 [Calditrichota bacterium]